MKTTKEEKKLEAIDKHTFDDLLSGISKGFMRDPDKLKRIKVKKQ